MSMSVERETAGLHPAEERASLWGRFLQDYMMEIAQTSALAGALILVGTGITAWLLAGYPSYSEAGGFAKAAVWVVWLAVFGITTAFKWRVMLSSAEAKGYSLEELYGSIVREYLPVGGAIALLGVAMTVAICRLDHAEYLLGLWLMAWGCAAIAMGVQWTLRAILAIGVALVALGFFQVLLWPSHVLLTLGMLGLFWLAAGAYFWYAA
jgi:hypothetical protein